MKYVYLASPYSHNNPAVRQLRYEMARVTTMWYLERGFAIFSPIVYGYHMERTIGMAYKNWQPLNDAMLHNAGSVLVLKIDGWDESAGIKHEVEMAKSLKLPVNYIEYQEVTA